MLHLLPVELMFTLSTRLCYTHLTLISCHFAVVASRWLQCADGLLLINDLCRLWCLANYQIFGQYKPHFPHNICYKSGGVAYSLVRLYIVRQYSRQYKTGQSMLWCCQSRKSSAVSYSFHKASHHTGFSVVMLYSQHMLEMLQLSGV